MILKLTSPTFVSPFRSLPHAESSKVLARRRVVRGQADGLFQGRGGLRDAAAVAERDTQKMVCRAKFVRYRSDCR